MRRRHRLRRRHRAHSAASMPCSRAQRRAVPTRRCRRHPLLPHHSRLLDRAPRLVAPRTQPTPRLRRSRTSHPLDGGGSSNSARARESPALSHRTRDTLPRDSSKTTTTTKITTTATRVLLLLLLLPLIRALPPSATMAIAQHPAPRIDRPLALLRHVRAHRRASALNRRPSRPRNPARPLRVRRSRTFRRPRSGSRARRNLPAPVRPRRQQLRQQRPLHYRLQPHPRPATTLL